MGGPYHSSYTECPGGCEQVRDGGEVVRKIGKNSCELCCEKARVYCAADQAHLCLVCDYKVHNANFLVSKHSRDVLCASCGALTLSALAGPRIDRHQARHCTQCAGVTGNGDDDDDDNDVSSIESRSSSCCTHESQQDGSHAVHAHVKRRAFITLEEGCGDSEDPRHRSPFPSKRTRVALTRTTSHTHTQPSLVPV